MAARRPEPPSRKRMNSISDLKRDQPPFTSRQVAPSQQAPDFFTQSLNSSYIPSPSPVRSPPKRQNGRAKQRPASGSGRSLAAAFKATASFNEAKQRPTTSSSSELPQSQHGLKPRPAQSDARPRSSPANDRSQARTPSPARGRPISLISPVSSQHSQSSPPRGLAEAYQRIVDEESLADQESVADDMDAYGYDHTDTDLSHQFNSPQSQQNPREESPMSLKASRKASREPTPARDYSENKENKYQGSQDGSGRSSLEDITNRSLDSAISQHEKDARRINRAINSDVKIFSKARVGPRVGLTVENLRRNNSSAESLGSGSLHSRGSEPSLNFPKAWGRKSKPEKGWLSRINSKSGKLTGDVPKKQKADSPIIAQSEKREWDEPIDEWIQDAAEVPLTEQDSPQKPPTSEGSTPTTAQKGSKEQNSGWDLDADFTARSLQVSDSPPMRMPNDALRKPRDPEIDSIEKRAVTTSRLGALRGQGSQESLGRRSPENMTRATHRNQRRSSSRSSIPALEGQRRGLTSELSFEDGGDHIPDTPVVIYRNSPDIPDKDSGAQTARESSSSKRPTYQRHDSRDILQRLSRATGASPAPLPKDFRPRQSNADSEMDTSTPKSNAERSASRRKEQSDSEGSPAENDTTSQQAPEVLSEDMPRVSNASSRLKTPQITGGWVDNTIMEDTPRGSMPSVNLKTPFVTGAWIDTPLPTGGRGPPMPTPNLDDDKDFILEGSEKRRLATSDLIKKLSPKSDKEPMKNSGRPLPKSALESVLTAAKASLDPNGKGKQAIIVTNSDSEEDPTFHLGESTIQSLEDILADDTEVSSPPSPPLTDKEDEDPSPRAADLKPYTRQLSRLSSLLPSIRDARENIAQLERAVAQSSQALVSQKQPQGPCTEAGEFHDFIWPCERCGCPARSVSGTDGSGGFPKSLVTFKFKEDMTMLEIPIPRIWRWRKDDWRPRLTWFGLLLLLGWSWWLAEGWMCDVYCHPRYAYSYKGYGVDINSPRPPFVLEKILWRWLSIGTILRPLYILLRAIVRLAAQAVGWIVGFNSGGGNPVVNSQPSIAKQPVSTDPNIPRPAWAPDLSMMDDEYL